MSERRPSTLASSWRCTLDPFLQIELELELDPLREATNLWEYLGLRNLCPDTVVQVNNRMPRIKLEDLLRHLGVSTLTEASEPLEWLFDATLAATALESLEGSNRKANSARRALVHVVDGRLSIADMQELLNISRSTVYRLQASCCDLNLVRAIRLQVGLRIQLGNRTGVEGPFLLAEPS